MDYSYVRMRNAIKDKDREKAEYYRGLYESGKEVKRTLTVVDYVIFILVLLVILLGIYILYSETQQAAIPLDIPYTPAPTIPIVGEVA